LRGGGSCFLVVWLAFLFLASGAKPPKKKLPRPLAIGLVLTNKVAKRMCIRLI
jgi:hypothetical protein